MAERRRRRHRGYDDVSNEVQKEMADLRRADLNEYFGRVRAGLTIPKELWCRLSDSRRL